MALGLGADVEATDVLKPDERDSVAVARATENADLRDPLPVEDASRSLLGPPASGSSMRP